VNDDFAARAPGAALAADQEPAVLNPDLKPLEVRLIALGPYRWRPADTHPHIVRTRQFDPIETGHGEVALTARP
jgi:hypothetical protein